jgi:hypothetical protein
MTRHVWSENGAAVEMGAIKILLSSIPVMSDYRKSVAAGHLHLCMLVVVLLLLLLHMQMVLLLLLFRRYLGPIVVSRQRWLIHV